MHRCGEAPGVAGLTSVRQPECLGQLNRPLQAPTEQNEIHELARLDRRRVEEASIRRREPHAQKKRQCPEMKRDMILARRSSMLETVRLAHAEHASAERPLPDFPAQQVATLLQPGVQPPVMHLFARLDSFDDLPEIRERANSHGTDIDFEPPRIEAELFLDPAQDRRSCRQSFPTDVPMSHSSSMVHPATAIRSSSTGSATAMFQRSRANDASSSS